MKFSISAWMAEYQEKVEEIFGNRIWVIGLQGSYGRNEASEQSDIDVVLILDQVSAEDQHTYEKVLDSLPAREKICGFVSGKEELLSVLQGRDRDILEKSMEIKAKESISGPEQERLSSFLLEWASEWICRCGKEEEKA